MDQTLPSPARATCRALALSLLTLGAILAATVPSAEAGLSAPCTLHQPLSCCELLGINCDIHCTNPLEPVCCLLHNPTQPQACTGGPCDPTQPLTCCPPTINCSCPPTTISALCCILENPTNVKACTKPPCDPAQPLTCCPPQVLSCRCPVTPIPLLPCCFVDDPLNPYACGGCNGAAGMVCETDLCIADGLLVTEQDALGGTSRNAYAESRISSITPANGIYALPPGPSPSPPPNAMVHADAQLVGAQYSNPSLLGGISVSASTVFSRCDMNAVNDPAGLFADTYGRGGVKDIDLTILGQTVSLTALDFELQAFGNPGGATAAWHCDVADLGVNNPAPSAVAAICALPISSVSAAGVTVWINEVKPPVYDPVNGYTHYEGSHLHVQVSGPVLVDIYVGFVHVAVASGPAAAPAVYLPHGPCLVTPVCT